MNIDLSEELDALAKKAGAIVSCPECRQYDVSAGDEEAEARAHAMAQKAFKDGRLRAPSAVEVSKLMGQTLESANLDCPECE